MTEFVFLSMFSAPSKVGMPLGVAIFFTIFVFGLLRLFWMCDQKPTAKLKPIHRSKIQHTCSGNPESYRHRHFLSSFTRSEFVHLRIAIINGIREAAAFNKMDLPMMRMLLEQSDMISVHFGLTPSESASIPDEILVEYFQKRYAALRRILNRMDYPLGKPQTLIEGITDLEYDHLLISLRASHSIALVYGKVTKGQACRAVAFLKGLCEELGVKGWDHWDKWLGDLPGFMRGREVVLAGMMVAVEEQS